MDNPASVIAVDKISFSGTTQNVPDPDFENWKMDTVVTPVNWPFQEICAEGYTSPVRRTTDGYTGNYALEIQNVTGFDESKGFRITAGQLANYTPEPSFPLRHKPLTLNGFFK